MSMNSECDDLYRVIYRNFHDSGVIKFCFKVRQNKQACKEWNYNLVSFVCIFFPFRCIKLEQTIKNNKYPCTLVVDAMIFIKLFIKIFMILVLFILVSELDKTHKPAKS